MSLVNNGTSNLAQSQDTVQSVPQELAAILAKIYALALQRRAERLAREGGSK